MTLHQFLLILRARWKLAGSVLGLAILVALLAVLFLPPRYKATATVVADVRATDPTGLMGGAVLAGVATPTWMPTQVDIINSERVALRVVRALGLERNAAIRESWLNETDGVGSLQMWLVQALKSHLDVKPARDSNVIAITYESPDVALSAAIANAFAQAYLETNVEMKVEPARQSAEWFQGQLRAARDNLEKIQARISAYQQEKGLVSADERVDVESTRLSDLTAQLAVLQAGTADAASRAHAAGATADAAETMPETLQNGAVIGLKNQIAATESRLRELGARYGEQFPDYQRTAAALAALRSHLATETGRIAASFGNARAVGAGREAALRKDIARQRAKLLELKHQRAELGVLLREGESAQRAYDAIAQRTTQLSLESQSNQASVQILTPAVAPIRPASPDPFLAGLLALFGGTLCALIAAFGREIADRRVRTDADLEGTLGIPLLVGMDAAHRSRGLAVTGWRRAGRALLPGRLFPSRAARLSGFGRPALESGA